MEVNLVIWGLIIGLIKGNLFTIAFFYYHKWMKRVKVKMVENEKMELNIHKVLQETILKFEQYKDEKEKEYWFKVKFFDYVHKDLIPNYFIPEKDLTSTIKFYKQLLHKIKDRFEDKYLEIHKGVPFFFIGWYSFLLKNYDQSIFYLDAALAEDKKTHIKNSVWATSGAANFFKLNSEYKGLYEQFSTKKLQQLLKHSIDKFNIIAGCNITIEDFREKFVGKLLVFDNLILSHFDGERLHKIEPLEFPIYSRPFMLEDVCSTTQQKVGERIDHSGSDSSYQTAPRTGRALAT